MRISIIGACLALLLSGCGLMPAEQDEGGSQVDTPVTIELAVSELVAVIHAVDQMPAAEALDLQADLSHRIDNDARLKLALLALYGPEEVAETEQGLAGLERLSRHPDAFRYAETQQLLLILQQHWATQRQLRARHRQLSQQLATEQAAHADTYEKLEALRRIEDDIGSRDDPASEDDEAADER